MIKYIGFCGVLSVYIVCHWTKLRKIVVGSHSSSPHATGPTGKITLAVGSKLLEGFGPGFYCSLGKQDHDITTHLTIENDYILK